MKVEIPPIEGALKGYLIRMFKNLYNAMELQKTCVCNEVKNPIKGRLYLIESPSAQFPSAGMYYYSGVTFVKLD